MEGSFYQHGGVVLLREAACIRGQVHPPPGNGLQAPGLAYRLPLALTYPPCGSIGRNGYQWHAAVVCFGKSGAIVQRRRSGGAHKGHGAVCDKGYAETDEGGAAFVHHRMQTEAPAAAKRHGDGCAPRARRYHHIFYAVPP